MFVVRSLAVVALLLAAPSAGFGLKPAPVVLPTPLPALPENARTDENGLPCFLLDGRPAYNPAYLAQAAADPGQPETVRTAARKACVARLRAVRQGTLEADLLMYDYRYPYHGRVIEPPFPSAYAQASWVRACIFEYETKGGAEALARLKRAAAGFRIDRAAGGFFAPAAGWFEELPDARILNGHLDATLALLDAADRLEDRALNAFALAAARAAARQLPAYDAGDWSRYDLDVNPAGGLFELRAESADGWRPVRIDEIEATWGWGAGNPVGVTSPEAWDGNARLAGRWSAPSGPSAGRPLAPGRFVEPEPGDLYGLADRSLAQLEWPPDPRLAMAAPWERPGAPRQAVGIRFTFDRPGTLELRVRDASYTERYVFRPVGRAGRAGPGTQRLEFALPPGALSFPTGEKYHRLHIRLLRELAGRVAGPAREVLSTFADRFQSRLADNPPRDGKPKAPRIRFLRPGELAIADLSGAVYPDPLKAPALAVDGDPDSVFLLRPDELSRTFEIRLSYPVALRGVGFDFYASPFVPSALALDAGTAEVFALEAGRPEKFWVNLDPAPLRDRLTFRFLGPSEKGLVILREFRLLVDPDLPTLVRLRDELPDLARNRPPAWDDLVATAEALRRRFPLGAAPGGTIRDIVRGGVAQCADRVALLGGLLDLANVSWRAVNICNVPNPGDGHTAMEIWHGGAWRYLDPSFGFYVPGPDGPRSFSELTTRPELAAAGRAAPGAPEMKGLDSPDFFRRADPAGPAGPLDPMSFPVTAGTLGVSLGAYGPAADAASCRDLDSMFTPGIPAGLSYVGQSQENRSLCFRFPETAGRAWEVTLVPAYRTDDKFELKLSADGGTLDGPAAWRPAFVGFRTDETQILRLRFTPERPGAALRVGFSPGRYPSYLELDAIRVAPVTTAR